MRKCLFAASVAAALLFYVPFPATGAERSTEDRLAKIADLIAEQADDFSLRQHALELAARAAAPDTFARIWIDSEETPILAAGSSPVMALGSMPDPHEVEEDIWVAIDRGHAGMVESRVPKPGGDSNTLIASSAGEAAFQDPTDSGDLRADHVDLPDPAVGLMKMNTEELVYFECPRTAEATLFRGDALARLIGASTAPDKSFLHPSELQDLGRDVSEIVVVLLRCLGGWTGTGA